ncbi:MAG: SDR family oxidoreductase [Lentisphaeria bacterium]|nr:SDR family oxidoreductase [Lentisphaeria bacterium]
MKLENKIAIVTGGGSGIGEAISLRFAAEGAQVVILEYNTDGATAVIKQIQEAGGKAEVIRCDVSNSKEVSTAFRAIKEKHGRIDILVNNAGIAAVGNVESCTEEELDRVYAVNVKGVYLCLHNAIPYMLEQGSGAIVNMASIASTIGIPDRFAYAMTKGAVYTMTQSVATDYIDKNIRCNSVSPARVHTPFVDGFIAKNYPGKEEEMFEKLSATQPIGRMAKPKEVANMVTFLASDEADFITGNDYLVDGGFIKIKK